MIQAIFEWLGISEMGPDLKTRFSLASFALLVFVMLLYFWMISRSKIKAVHKRGDGLVYLAFAFLLYALLGYAAVFLQDNQHALLVISGIISVCLLSSLSFFAQGQTLLDQIVAHPAWKNGIKYLGFGWVILLSLAEGAVLLKIDQVITALAIIALGFFISRYFWNRGLRFLSLISSSYFLLFFLLQFLQTDGLAGGKFVHVNTIILSPALALAVIVLAFTFNWLNEIDFYQLSNIWVGDRTPGEQQTTFQGLSGSEKMDAWTEKISKDKIEDVIEEFIIFKRHRNENLEALLNLAARNSRNNKNQLQGLISYEDYQLNRNQLSHALMQLVQGKL